MSRTTPLGLAIDVLRSNLSSRSLPYKLTLVATYRCNFRCEMCSICRKTSVDEMTPDEVEQFFHLFVRRDLDDVSAAILYSNRALYLLDFPTTGWFGDRTVAMVDMILRRGVGRLMTTNSIDGPAEGRDEMRGLPGSRIRAIETFKRLRGIRRSHYQVMLGMTLLGRNASLVEATVAAVRTAVLDFSEYELHLNIGHESAHHFDDAGHLTSPPSDTVVEAIEAHRVRSRARLNACRFTRESISSPGQVKHYCEHHESPLPCSALSSSCFIDAHWNLFPCSIWDRPLRNLRNQRFDLQRLWNSQMKHDLRRAVVGGQCPHCWTPCEA